MSSPIKTGKTRCFPRNNGFNITMRRPLPSHPLRLTAATPAIDLLSNSLFRNHWVGDQGGKDSHSLLLQIFRLIISGQVTFDKVEEAWKFSGLQDLGIMATQIILEGQQLIFRDLFFIRHHSKNFITPLFGFVGIGSWFAKVMAH